MTSGIIYHDFSGKDTGNTGQTQETTLYLTAGLLAKGRRIAKINQNLQILCLVLCGACVGVSGMILCMLMGVFG